MLTSRRQHLPLPLDLLIFDMDGVLIDVSRSYRKTIQTTVHLYLATCLGHRRRKSPLALAEAISLFKSAGGFNNDWDLTTALLLYLLSESGLPSSSKRKKFSSIPETVAFLKAASSPLEAHVVSPFDIPKLSSFLDQVKASGGGLKGVRRSLQGSWEGWVYGSGSLDQENLVKRIFQEVYLGERFGSCYPLRRLFYQGRGYYLQERMLIPRAILSALKKRLRLGIASGRPRFEAELTLKRFRLLSYFSSVITLDESLKEQERVFRATGRAINFSKPHPYPLLKAVQESGMPHPRCAYVGDVVDDILAAKAAKRKHPILAVGFGGGRKNTALEEALVRAGADLMIRHPRELLGLVSRSGPPGSC